MSTHSDPQDEAGISCIICAFNEAPRIAAVLAIVSRHPLLKEVIVVDDGSDDNTREVVEAFPSVKLISYPENRGKSFAMATGVEAAQCELLMLLDADLTGLSIENVTDLATPVLSGKAGVSLSLRRNSLLLFRVIDLDFVTGERVVRKEILSEALDEVFRLPRFGIEVFMNRQIIARRLSISVTRWPGVSQSRKTEKLGYWKGIRAEWRMIADLLRVTYPVALVTQTCQLLSLRTQRSGVVKSVIRILKLRYSDI
jgi:glycosyltransferase involved in cell wall biosynthesis